MAINYDDDKYSGKYVFLPKIGYEATFEIKSISEVQCTNPKLNFSRQEPVLVNGQQVVDDEGKVVTKAKDLGYHVECVLASGKTLSVTNIAAFKSVFKAHQVTDGDTIRVQHLNKGEWKVEKLNG